MRWPESGVWYDARVERFDAKTRVAAVYYPDSLGNDGEGEQEELNLADAVLDDEVSWPVFKDEATAREVMARREANDLARDRRAKPADTKAAHARAQQLAEEKVVRDKVRDSVREAMEMATRENAAEGHADDDVGSPSDVATAVEEALYAKCGSVDKEYRTRARSLMFNLKDLHNPQLRARVLANDLRAESVVGMSPQELASKELVEWRKARQRAAGEDAFIKGAALEDLVVKKDGKNEIHVEIKRDDPQGTIKPQVEQTPSAEDVVVDVGHEETQVVDAAWDATDEQGAVSDADEEDENDSDEDEDEEEPKESDAGDNEMLSFEKFVNGGDQDEEEEEEEEEEAPAEPEEDYEPEDGPEYDPEAPVDDEEEYEPENDPTDVPLPNGAWEGAIDIAGMTSLYVRAVPIGGEGASVGDIMPESITVKGRVDYKSMQSFVKQVHRSSTSRAVTLVHISSAPSGGDAAESAMAKLVKQYRERGRCGVAKTDEGIELYIAPRGKDVEKVIVSVGLTPGQVSPSTGMVGMCIHPRGIGPNVRENKRTRAQMETVEEDYEPAAQFIDVPPPPPPQIMEVPPPPPPPPPPAVAAAPAPAPAFDPQHLQSLISNASNLFSGAPPPPKGQLVKIPPPPPPPGR